MLRLHSLTPLPLSLARQTFAIPGSFLLNILAGAHLGVLPALLVVAMAAASGATCCYALSFAAGQGVMQHPWLVSRVAAIRAAVVRAKASGSLFWYLLSLRLLPVTPNYIVNISSPWVGVPPAMFWLTMAVGLTPYNYATVAAGAALGDLRPDFAVMDVWLFLKLTSIAGAALVPTLCISRVRRLAGTPEAGDGQAATGVEAEGGDLPRPRRARTADAERPPTDFLPGAPGSDVLGGVGFQCDEAFMGVRVGQWRVGVSRATGPAAPARPVPV